MLSSQLIRGVRLIAPHAARGLLTIVPQAQVAYREFLGMNRVRLEPGIHLNLPFLHRVRKFPLTEACWRLEDMNAYTKDNVPIKATGTIFGRIYDAEKAAYEVDDVWGSVAAVGSSCARAIIGR